MLLYVIFAVMKLAAGQSYSGPQDYSLLGPSMLKYYHPPAPFFYKPTPISENAYGYYPPYLWPRPQPQTQPQSYPQPQTYPQPQPQPVKQAPRSDKEDDEDTWDVRSHSRFCKLFEGNSKTRSGQQPPDEYTELLMRKAKKNEESKRRADEVLVAPRLFVPTNQTSAEAPKANPKVDMTHKIVL